jgi:REP element-mobilizing transposase RayT
MPAPERKSPRIREYDYAAGSYFVTVCVRSRACILGDVVDDEMRLSRVGKIVVASWRAIPAHFPSVSLDVFVVMPNHFHGILSLSRAGHAPPLPAVIGSFKGAASRAAGRRLWQRSFYDRVIRNESELQALRQYVVDNPLAWALDGENPARA